MSQQDTQLLGNIRDILKGIADNLHPNEPIGINGGEIQHALPYLDGWAYVNEKPAPPIAIAKGQRKQLFPDWSDEEGWMFGGIVIFDDPDAHLSLVIDNLQFDGSPRILSNFTEAIAGIISVRNMIYNPVIQAFGFDLGVTQLAPYKTRVKVEGYLGDESPNTTANITRFELGKIKINDRKAFFNSLKRFAYQQSNGNRNAVVREN